MNSHLEQFSQSDHLLALYIKIMKAPEEKTSAFRIRFLEICD